MAKEPSTPRGSEQAMNTVLEAEREAERRIAECQAEARQIVESARQSARRIAERTDARISRVHAHCATTVGQQVETLLNREQSQQNTASPAHEQAALEAAVERLADLLTGNLPEEEDEEAQ
jgi:vacuolar-type H+-ATPase subunit H